MQPSPTYIPEPPMSCLFLRILSLAAAIAVASAADRDYLGVDEHYAQHYDEEDLKYGYPEGEPILWPPNAGMAPPPREAAQMDMDKWDHNKDGKVDLAEIREELRNMYWRGKKTKKIEKKVSVCGPGAHPFVVLIQ